MFRTGSHETDNASVKVSKREPFAQYLRGLVQMVGLVHKIMVRPVNDVHGLVVAADPFVDQARMRLWHSIIGTALNREERHGN